MLRTALADREDDVVLVEAAKPVVLPVCDGALGDIVSMISVLKLVSRPTRSLVCQATTVSPGRE